MDEEAFWSLQSKTYTTGPLFEKPMDLVDMTWYMLLPFLMEKGKEEYDQINNYCFFKSSINPASTQ